MKREAPVDAVLVLLLLSTCGATACGRVGYELVPGHSAEGGVGSGAGDGQFVARRTAAGYDVEAYVTGADLGLSSWPLSLGATVGFDLGFNLSFESPTQINQGHRLGQYFSRLASSGYPEPYRNASAFCLAVLGAR